MATILCMILPVLQRDVVPSFVLLCWLLYHQSRLIQTVKSNNNSSPICVKTCLCEHPSAKMHLNPTTPGLCSSYFCQSETTDLSTNCKNTSDNLIQGYTVVNLLLKQSSLCLRRKFWQSTCLAAVQWPMSKWLWRSLTASITTSVPSISFSFFAQAELVPALILQDHVMFSLFLLGIF